MSILAERMKDKAEQERMETEKVFKKQLLTLRDGLQASPQNALSTMLDAMLREITGARQRLNEQYKVLSLAFGRKWIALASLGAALCLGMLAAGWLTVEIWAWKLLDYRSELARLKQEYQAVRRELDVMKPERTRAETWGLKFQEDESGRFIVLPEGMKIVTGWKVGERQAIKLER